MIAFDDASPQFESHVFELRFNSLLSSIHLRHPFIVSFYFLFFFKQNDCWRKYTIAPHKRCTTRKQLNNEIKEIIEKGGEGVILRKPKTVYERGKSHSLLKLKVLLLFTYYWLINKFLIRFRHHETKKH